MTSNELLRLHDARVQRDGRVILHVADLSIAEGERVAILGPNGAGKSTLVSMLTGDVKPLWADEAPIRFRGQRLWDLSAARRDIGVVSHSMQDSLERRITPLDAVAGALLGAIGIPVHVRPTPEQYAEARAALERLGVGGLADRSMTTLSTGESRRVVIARALVTGPSILVFDEPTAGLDPGAAYDVRTSLSALSEQGVSLLLVTHHVEDVPASVERVLLLGGGEIVADGAPETLIESERLSSLFGAPLEVRRTPDGGWHLF